MKHAILIAILALYPIISWRVVAGSGSVLTDSELFDPQTLVEVDIRMPAEDWEALRVQSRSEVEARRPTLMERPFSYFKADVTINGVEIKGVSVRKKGGIGSLDKDRPSLKIHLAQNGRESPFIGLDRLTLNNNHQDRSLSSQSLAYGFFRRAGIPAPRCNHARVTINGESLGVYSNVESIRPVMLERRFGNGGGDLFEGTMVDFYAEGIARFEAKRRRTDFGSVQRLVSILEQDDLDLQALAAVLDLDAFVRYWAAESLLGFWDGYTQNHNNFFLYRNRANAKLYFIPWGVDVAFESSMEVDPFEIKYKSVHHRALLPNRLYREPAIRKHYADVLNQLLEQHWVVTDLCAEVDRIEALVTPHLHETQHDAVESLEAVRDFIRTRKTVIETEQNSGALTLLPPHRPEYFREVGVVTLTFASTWSENLPADPFSSGTIENLTTPSSDDDSVQLRLLGVHAGPNPEPGSWKNDSPTIFIFARHESDDTQAILVIVVPEGDFKSGDREIPISGLYIDGETMGGGAAPVYDAILGTIRFDTAGMNPGDSVRGRASIRLMHFGHEPGVGQPSIR